MVRGIQRFQEHFKDHVHQYVLIGGAACDLIMQEAALPFRATKDLDIVLCVEVLDKAFGEAFWEFIRAGKYKIQQRSSGEKRYYRFMEPEEDDYPWMLELFSRKPEAFPLVAGSHLTPSRYLPKPVRPETSSSFITVRIMFLMGKREAFIQKMIRRTL
jgi:hypothetical protein